MEWDRICTDDRTFHQGALETGHEQDDLAVEVHTLKKAPKISS